MMDRKTMIRVAQLYYDEGFTQQKIAKLMGLSRVTINALLKKARETGIVSIWIVDDEVCQVDDLEEQLKARFGLKDAVVVECPQGSEDLVRRHIGMAGARYLEGILKDGDTLACSWGRTLWELASVLKPGQRRINVVQLNGGLGQVFDRSLPSELARHLAQVFGGQYFYLHAPGIVENGAIREAMLSDGAIRETIARANGADVAACGIGSLAHSSLVEFGCIDESIPPKGSRRSAWPAISACAFLMPKEKSSTLNWTIG